MKARVLLINPPTSRDQFIGSDDYFPLGLLSLATVFKQHGMETKIRDINNHFFEKELNQTIFLDYIQNELLPYVEMYCPAVIGIGCIFSGAFENLKLAASEIKKKFPNIPIVIGGIHPTIFAKDIIKKYPYIDYVIIGEGEHSFLLLVKSLVKQSDEYKTIDGIAYRSNGDAFINPKTSFIEDLDSLPFVDYDLLDEEYFMDTSGWYSPKNIPVGQPYPIITSRSCPNRCTFCSMWLVHGSRFRPRSPENVLDEMQSLYEKRNARYFQFMDDSLTYDKQRILAICRGIKDRNMDIQFDTPNGVAINRLDQETVIDAMVDAGMIRISIAIESGSEYIRNKAMRKGLTTQKIHEVVNACAKYPNLFINAFFIIGMPQETDETLHDTYDLISSLPIDKYALSFATPYPGTELFKYCINYNLLPYKAEEYVDIGNLQGRSDLPHFKPHELTNENLVAFQKKCQNYLMEKRNLSPFSPNYPLRYKGGNYDQKVCIEAQ